jgi:hypothetical protein
VCAGELCLALSFPLRALSSLSQAGLCVYDWCISLLLAPVLARDSFRGSLLPTTSWGLVVSNARALLFAVHNIPGRLNTTRDI